jgi:hypothetical protein
MKLSIPINVDMDIMTLENGKYRVLLDDGILHAISVRILELLDQQIGDSLNIWQEVSVYYKIPHRLVSQAILSVKIPDILKNTSKPEIDLITQAIDSLIGDLSTILSLFT